MSQHSERLLGVVNNDRLPPQQPKMTHTDNEQRLKVSITAVIAKSGMVTSNTGKQTGTLSKTFSWNRHFTVSRSNVIPFLFSDFT